MFLKMKLLQEDIVTFIVKIRFSLEKRNLEFLFYVL